MTASSFSALFSGGIAFVLYLVSQQVDSRPIQLLLNFMSLGLIVWWCIWGHSLEGWIGPSYEDLLKEQERLQAQIRQWEQRPQGTTVPFDIGEVMRKEDRIRSKLQFHPGRPNRH